VLHWILRACAGKAECWVSKETLARQTGYTPRTIQRILREFEGVGETEEERADSAIIRCVVDRSLRAQRRIVLVDHPNAVRVLARFGALPWMQVGETKEVPKPAAKVHPGETNDVHPGETNDVHVGETNRPPNFSIPPNSKPRNSGSFSLPTGTKTPVKPQKFSDVLAWFTAGGPP
jgi:hypothetical protein